MSNRQPIDYASWQTPKRDSRFKGLFGWVLFIALAVLLFLLLNKPSGTFTSIPLSTFESELEAGNISTINISGHSITGNFIRPTPVGSVTVTRYQTDVPDNASGDWKFMQWILENRRGATVTVENNPTLLMNILVPLIPWILIFGFIWFFIFRQLRNRAVVPQPAPVYIVQGPNQPPPPLA